MLDAAVVAWIVALAEVVVVVMLMLVVAESGEYELGVFR